MKPYPMYRNGLANLQAFVEKWESKNSQLNLPLEESLESIPESETTQPESRFELL